MTTVKVVVVVMFLHDCTTALNRSKVGAPCTQSGARQLVAGCGSRWSLLSVVQWFFYRWTISSRASVHLLLVVADYYWRTRANGSTVGLLVLEPPISAVVAIGSRASYQ